MTPDTNLDIGMLLSAALSVIGVFALLTFMFVVVCPWIDRMLGNSTQGRSVAPATGRPLSTALTFPRTLSYRTLDQSTDFRFRFVRTADGTFRVYILGHPPYAGRREDSEATHRLSDRDGQYICWTQPIKTYEQAQAIAKLWAERTMRYIATGIDHRQP